METVNRSIDITTDLTAGDVDIRANRDAGGDAKWTINPKAILISTTVDSVEAIVLKTHRDGTQLTMELKSNVIHPIAVGTVVKAGTTLEQIIIFGD